MNTAVTLWIPGLLNPQRVEEAADLIDKQALPVLKQMLSKADAYSYQSQPFYETACHLFHQPAAHPIASTMASQQLEDYDSRVFWLKVDPVQMIPDRDTLVLFPAKDLAITETESKALIAAFNHHFEQDKVQLEFASPQSWYLRIVQPVDIQTTSLDEASYQSLNGLFPKGNAASYWRQLINEVQMLFYAHPVNEARRMADQPEINSVWVWGEGILNEADIQQRPDAAIYSSNPYLKGVGHHCGSHYYSGVSSYQQWSESDHSAIKHHFILLDALHQTMEQFTIEEWLEALHTLEKDWLYGLNEAVKSKQISSLLLDLGGEKRFHLEPKHFRRFWRGKKPLPALSKA